MSEGVAERNEGLPEEEFAALMQNISTVAPLVKGFLSPVGGRGEGSASPLGGKDHGSREALLCALKPYLSPSRCEAVDYLIRLWRVGDAIKALR